jgi:hypothetical protein
MTAGTLVMTEATAAATLVTDAASPMTKATGSAVVAAVIEPALRTNVDNPTADLLVDHRVFRQHRPKADLSGPPVQVVLATQGAQLQRRHHEKPDKLGLCGNIGLLEYVLQMCPPSRNRNSQLAGRIHQAATLHNLT